MIPLQRRILVTLAAVVAAVLFACLTLVVVLVRRDELLALDRVILTEARLLARELERTATTAGELLAARTLALPEAGMSDALVAVLDAEGHVLTPSNDSLGREENLPGRARHALSAGRPGAAFDLTVRERPLRGVIVPLSGRRVLLYAASREAVDEDLRFLLRVLPVLFLAALACTAVVSSWLGRRLAGDVVRIGEVARAVTDGNLAARVGENARGARETYELGKDLDEMVARLAALLEAQRRFAVDAAHELRSPIATLRGEIQLALRRDRSAESYRKILEELLGDVEALTRLAEDLLALSRAEGVQAASEQATAREIVDDALWMAQGLLSDCGATCQVIEREGAGAVHVRGSRGELARVVRNLLDNAIRYGARGGPIAVELSADAEHVHVAVVDHGPGVSPGEREAIFSAFHRGAQGLRAGKDGAGLGLFIAREIARAHRGDVTIDSQVAEGARFVLELPRPAEAA